MLVEAVGAERLLKHCMVSVFVNVSHVVYEGLEGGRFKTYHYVCIAAGLNSQSLMSCNISFFFTKVIMRQPNLFLGGNFISGRKQDVGDCEQDVLFSTWYFHISILENNVWYFPILFVKI